MLLFGVILAAVVIVGVVCAIFWNNIVDWLKKVGNKISEKLQKVVYGTKILATKTSGKLKNISKNYVRSGTEWEEYVITKEITEDEVPDYIKALAESEEIDITKDLELKLQH